MAGIYRCTNIGNCNKADSEERIHLPAADNPICPECGSLLMEVSTKRPKKVLPFLLVAGGVLVLGGIGFRFFTTESNLPNNRSDLSAELKKEQQARQSVERYTLDVEQQAKQEAERQSRQDIERQSRQRAERQVELVTVSFAQTLGITIGNKSLVFGSQKILEGIWTDEQLKGNLSDKKIRRLSSPDVKPPGRIIPSIMDNPLDKEFRNSIRSVIPFYNDKIVALTFDLCEKADDVTGYDADIVNILRSEKVKATFFAGGKWMRSHEEKTMQLMADPLFELGNHGWTHGNLAKLSHDKIIEQILWTQSQYELIREKLQQKVLARGLDSNEMDKIPQSLILFRPPYGRCSPDALNTLAEYGLASIQWNIVSGDPVRSQAPQKIVDTVLHRAKPGSIVVFHANGRGYATAEALPMIIDSLKEKGYKFVTVSELLKLGKIESFTDCFEIKPHDNGKYDRIFGTGTGEKASAQ